MTTCYNAASQNEIKNSERSAPGMYLTVVVVDDHEPIRQFVCLMLEERTDFRVISQAADGLEAIQKTKELQPDLILLDIGLPKLDGIAAATQIRKLAPKSKILFLSQNTSPEIVQAALGTGAHGYVVKSEAGTELFDALEAVIQGGQFVSPKLEGRITDNVTGRWKLRGKVLAACNCDWKCPCDFNALPTTGKCEGGFTWHVEDGTYDMVRLDELNFSVYVKWPGAVHHGNGEAVIFIDEQANNSQRLAIETLVRGAVGGPWGVLACTWTRVHGPYAVAYDIAFDGVRTKIKCLPFLEIDGGPMWNPATESESHPGVELPEGLIFKEGDVGASVRFRLNHEVQYDHSGKSLAVGLFDYSGPTTSVA